MDSPAAPTIVIVDPYSSGGMLAKELKARGAPCVAVEGSPTLPPSMRTQFDRDDFIDVISTAGDWAETLHRVKRHSPQYVVAGFESGVELADRLSAELQLPGNDAAWSTARRDKFAMTERVRQAGLRTAKQICGRDIEAIVRSIDVELDWPVIVKPPRSVASDHVTRCEHEEDVRRAAAAILGRSNVLGLPNDAVLVQEYLDGVEYAVDIVCRGGQQVVTAIWQYHRPEHHHPESSDHFICYDSMILLPYEGVIQEKLASFATKVLDALGIQFGPAHCELMYVQGEVVFVEVGTRLSASVNATLSRTCGGIGQLEKTVQAMLEPERFALEARRRPSLRRRAANVFLMPHRPGRLVQVRGRDILEALPTLDTMSIASTPGIDVGRVAGRVTLISDDVRAIERDIAVIRGLQERGIFEVED